MAWRLGNQEAEIPDISELSSIPASQLSSL
jgi:hypothetical protein